jgi:hypothetical protein
LNWFETDKFGAEFLLVKMMRDIFKEISAAPEAYIKLIGIEPIGV